MINCFSWYLSAASISFQSSKLRWCRRKRKRGGKWIEFLPHPLHQSLSSWSLLSPLLHLRACCPVDVTPSFSSHPSLSVSRPCCLIHSIITKRYDHLWRQRVKGRASASLSSDIASLFFFLLPCLIHVSFDREIHTKRILFFITTWFLGRIVLEKGISFPSLSSVPRLVFLPQWFLSRLFSLFFLNKKRKTSYINPYLSPSVLFPSFFSRTSLLLFSIRLFCYPDASHFDSLLLLILFPLLIHPYPSSCHPLLHLWLYRWCLCLWCFVTLACISFCILDGRKDRREKLQYFIPSIKAII